MNVRTVLVSWLARRERRHALDTAVEQQLGESVETDFRRLARPNEPRIGLVELRADPHHRRVDDVHDGRARANFVSLGELDEVAVAVDPLDDDEAAKGRRHLHELRVALGVPKCALGPLPANFQNANLGRRRFPLEIERDLQLIELRDGLVQCERVFLRVDLSE